MIKLEKTTIYGWEEAIRGMRNPMNSWEKSDSDGWVPDSLEDNGRPIDYDWEWGLKKVIGPNDHDLMMRLAKGGPVHAKYRRMITVYVDITAPLYWWKEFDTYKVGTVANSCSTMHKIHAKEFTIDDFSHEHLFKSDILQTNTDVLEFVIDALNLAREDYLKTKNAIKNATGSDTKKMLEARAKEYWWQMIQLLPSSYNQKRTIMLNYEVLTGIYPMRKNHKLDEWHVFCDWIEKLPYSEIIIGEKEKEKENE